jgi:predicted nuclease with TOPRIM domain
MSDEIGRLLAERGAWLLNDSHAYVRACAKEIATLKAERDRLQSEADYTRTERGTVMGYLKDAEIAVAALKAERDRLRSALRHLVNHWDEFGAEYGLDESFHLARRALEGK